MKVTGTDGKEYTIEPGANLTGDNLSYADLRGAILKSQKTNKTSVIMFVTSTLA